VNFTKTSDGWKHAIKRYNSVGKKSKKTEGYQISFIRKSSQGMIKNLSFLELTGLEKYGSWVKGSR
jgi:hypothetical protein